MTMPREHWSALEPVVDRVFREIQLRRSQDRIGAIQPSRGIIPNGVTHDEDFQVRALTRQLGTPFVVRRLTDLANDPDLSKAIGWLIPGLIPEGAALLLYGSPKVGKTTFAAAICAAIAQGGEFLGRSIASAGVLYCDMERPCALTVSRLREPFPDSEIPASILVSNQRPTLSDVRACIRSDGVRFIVLDSLVRLLRPVNENDAAEMSRLLAPWVDLAHSENAAIGCIHHDRKGGGEHGAGARGSNTIVATVDVAAHLVREAGDLDDGRRRLRIVGNFDGLEPELHLRREGVRYVAGATPAQSRQTRIIDVLQDCSELTAPRLAERLGQSRGNILPDLNLLVSAGRLTRLGNGSRGSPYRYRYTASHSVSLKDSIAADRIDAGKHDGCAPSGSVA
jgi:hypothetical protein